MAVLDHRHGVTAAPTTAPKTRTASTSSNDLSVRRPESRWQRRYVVRCMAADAIVALISGAAAYLLHFGSKVHGDYLIFTALLPLVWLLAISLNRAYEPRFLGVGSEEFRRVGRAGIALIAIVAFSAYATSIDVARHYVLISLPLVTVLTLGERYALRRWLHRRRAQAPTCTGWSSSATSCRSWRCSGAWATSATTGCRWLPHACPCRGSGPH